MKKDGIVLSFVFLFIGVSLYASINAVVSIVPQRFFVESIGGRYVNVVVMVKPGENPATYEPKPYQMLSLSKADVYFAIGVAFERVWLEKFKRVSPRIRIVHTDKRIKKRNMESFYKKGGIKDPHIWLSPPLVILQAREILDALVSMDSKHIKYFQDRYRKFVKKLVTLDLNIQSILGKKAGRRFLVYHPAWGYFADTYNLKQIAIEKEGKEPGLSGLRAVISLAKKLGIKVVFVQPQFSKRGARVIANAIGGKVVVADPLAYNYIDNMLKIARAFSLSVK